MISVIVPVYNTSKYLERCVNSLLKQTYRELEIILVDDGSTDGSGALCDRFAAENPRVRVFHKENGGSSSARNLGIEKAGGDYLGFVDSDDYVDADMYERLYAGIGRYDVKAAQIGRNELGPDGSPLPDICVPPVREECIAPDEFMRELLLHRGDCSFCTKLISRELFFPGEQGKPGAGEATECGSIQGAETEAGRKRRFPTGVLNEDFHLLIQMLKETGPVLSLPGHAYHVVYRPGSNSRKEGRENFSRVFADNVDNADLAVKIVAEDYPQLAAEAFRFGIFQRLDYMLHIPVSQMTRQNGMYRKVRGYLRKNWCRSMRNPLLTGKNKVYHTLFALAPRTVRKLHGRLRGLGKTTV